MEETITKIIGGIDGGDNNSPLLFVSKNLELLNSQIINSLKDYLKNKNIPSGYLYILEDTGESIKLEDIKSFVSLAESRSPYGIQIFFIENISRLTLASSNSLLKFFEEPSKGNMIILSNRSESNILDTILSRIQIIEVGNIEVKKENSFFLDLLDGYINNRSIELISYFYKNKPEVSEYLDFLENLIIYAKKRMIYVSYLDEINEDITLIKENNLNPRYITDKWLVKIKNS